MRPLRRFYLPDSLGIFYAALTQFLGYRANVDEYKVMGLASYGRPRHAGTFARMVRFENGRLRTTMRGSPFTPVGRTATHKNSSASLGRPARTNTMSRKASTRTWRRAARN